MSIRDFEILAAMDAEDEAEARAQADAPPAKRQKGAVFVSRAHPEGRPDTGTYAKPEADDTAVMDEASFRRTVLFAYIAKFTREVAFKEKRRMAERVYIDTATDEQLAARMRTYNKGVEREDFLELYRSREHWTHFVFEGRKLVAILYLGEIVHPETTQLLGSFVEEKVKIKLDERNYQRSHIILTAAKQFPRDGETADHIDPRFPLNDSISNLRWADGRTQRNNQIKNGAVNCHAQSLLFTKEGHNPLHFVSHEDAASYWGVTRKAVTNALKRGNIFRAWDIHILNPYYGNILPKHPLFKTLDVTDIGEYRTSTTGQGSTWRINSSTTRRYKIQIETKKCYIHRIAVECIIRRELEDDVQSDHVDSNIQNISLPNLWPTFIRINNIKKDQQFRVGSKEGTNAIFLSVNDAGQTLNIDRDHVSAVVNGKEYSAGGYTWRIASVSELERIFDEVDKLELKPWDEILAMLEDYKDHHYYELMKAQALLSKDYAEKLAAWRATLGRSAAA